MRRGFLRLVMVSFVLYFLPIPTQAASYSNMGCYDLWYARNAIFASKGQCFSSQRAINTFGRRCYSPYGRLNRRESNRVTDIKYWERRKGCRDGRGSTPSYQQNTNRYARVVGVSWNDTLAVRTGPSTRYRRIGNLAPNATGIRILRCSGRWCRISYGNLVGWSHANHLRSY